MEEIGSILKDQTILVTGSTGFMGKVLVEKLLRSIEFKHLYLLVRPRKGLTPHQRIESILSCPIFTEVKNSAVDIKSRITIVESDMSVSGLGLTPQDEGILKSQVNVIFHAAANVKFDEPLRVAYNINVRGTKELLHLAKKMDYLKAFVHVSTAYSQKNVPPIEERTYDLPIPYDKLEKLLDSLDDSIIAYMAPKIIGQWPNTYCYTKALAESVVEEFSRDLPVAIFRPGIVGSCIKEPLAGWMDNFYGPNGIVMGAFTGVLHVTLAEGNTYANLVPCDMADNALIAVAAKLTKKGREKNLKVYNYVSRDNPITYYDLRRYLETYGFNWIPSNALWVYFLFLIKWRWLYYLLAIIFHYIPAMLMDTLAAITGMKMPIRSFVQLYRRIDKTTLGFEPFTLRNWDWDTNNVQELWSELSPTDKKIFWFDIKSLDWDKFFMAMIRGVRIYLLNDDLSTVPKAIERYNKIVRANQCLKVILCIIVLKIAFSFSIVYDSFFSLIGYN